MHGANCTEMDTALFFSFRTEEIAEAKRACADCPVRTECLDGAVERREQYGVWGGMYFQAGQIILDKKNGGRPPKTPRKIDMPDIPVPAEYRHLVGV